MSEKETERYGLIKEAVVEGIKVSYSIVRRILNEAGLPSKRKHTGEKQFRRRLRREHFGKMLQADATPYDWFGRGKRSSLHGSSDDGRGKITGLYMHGQNRGDLRQTKALFSHFVLLFCKFPISMFKKNQKTVCKRTDVCLSRIIQWFPKSFLTIGTDFKVYAFIFPKKPFTFFSPWCILVFE